MKRQARRQSEKLGARPPRPPARAPIIDAEKNTLLLGVLLLVATLVAYQPIWNAGFIWDDDYYVTRNSTLLDVHGLRRIWFEVGAVPQYYPLVHSVFWVEQHLWGFQPLGYHLVNVVLHALAAVLLATVLSRLRIPGAWLAAGIFALHPVCVESVAWVTELKNVLSAVCYLAAALAYLRFTELQDAGSSSSHRRKWYVGALALYIAALFSKTVTCSLPAALLLVRWWRFGRLRRADLVPLLPFLVIGVALGLQTAAIEKHFIGAHGAEWSLSIAERILIAGRALWFYAAKLMWPTNLTFIYPRWVISSAVWWQWLFPIAAGGVCLSLWLARGRIGRAPLAAVLFFAGTLAPALGFINVYPMRYSFVADHFQYLASIGLITLVAAGFKTRISQLKRPTPLLEPALATLMLLTLGVMTWRQAEMYTSLETLWGTTIARNPNCSMAHNNLGNTFFARGQFNEALAHFQKAVDIEPDNAEAHESLGSVFLQREQVDDALAHFQRALALHPYAGAHYNVGTAFLRKGRVDDAIVHFNEALRTRPDYVEVHNNLGNVFFGKGEFDQAIPHYRRALELRPDFAEAANNLGSALLRSGQLDDAIGYYQRALQLRPSFADASNNLRRVAWILATNPEPSVRNGAKAVELAEQVDRLTGGRDPVMLATLAAAYAEAGRFPDAVASAQRALALSTGPNDTALFNELEVQLGSYQAGQPYRESGADPMKVSRARAVMMAGYSGNG